MYGLNQVSPSSLVDTENGYRLGNWALTPGSWDISAIQPILSVQSCPVQLGLFVWGETAGILS